MFRGIELREHDNLVVDLDADCDKLVDRIEDNALLPSQLRGHRLLRVVLPAGDALLMMTPMWGPASSDTEAKISLTTSKNLNTPRRWKSNIRWPALPHGGARLRCDFTAEPGRSSHQPWSEDPENWRQLHWRKDRFFEDDTAAVGAHWPRPRAGWTRGLCSPAE